MSFISHIRGGLANAQLEVSKHINAASINRAIQDVRNSIDGTAPQISRYITTGNSDQATGEREKNLGSVVHTPDEEAYGIQPNVATTSPEDAAKKATSHVEAGNIATSNDIIGECSSITTARQDDSEVSEVVNENLAARLSVEDKDGNQAASIDAEPSAHTFTDGAQAAARRLGNAAWENPMLTAATVVAGAGIAVIAAPALVTAPIMGIAGAVGFTPTGIAAYSTASAVHASIGNVAAGSLFATLQSAAAGGYGVAALTGAAQTAGGAVAGAGAIGTAVAWLKGKSKKEPSKEE